MRVEPHHIGSVMHVMKRGARGLPIVRDNIDRENFLKGLFYLNDKHQDQNWRHSLQQVIFPERPSFWPERKPLVDIWAWTLMPNHFHLIIHENQEGGIAKFMQRLCGSMSAYANARYGEKGSLFQGSYRGRVVEDDADLRLLASYVMVKNTLELYPGGLEVAKNSFEKAWQWGLRYPFSSMGIYGTNSHSPLMPVQGNILKRLFPSKKKFKNDSKAMLQAYKKKSDFFLED